MPALPLIAYSQQDADAASVLLDALTQSDLPPPTIAVAEGPRVEALAEVLPESPPHTVILLVSDALLRNPNIIAQLSDRLEEDRIWVVTVDLPSALDDQAFRYHYLDQWQRRYIDLRGESAHYPAEESEPFSSYLARVRQASLDFEGLLDKLAVAPRIAIDDVRSGNHLAQRFLSNLGTEAPPAPPSPSNADRSTEEIILHAWELCDAGDQDRALQLLRHTTEQRPGQAELRFQYALMLALEAQQPDRSREELDQLLAHYPKHHDGLFLSAELYAAQGNVAGARVQWDALYDLNPNYPKLDARLAELLKENYPQAAEIDLHFARAAKSSQVDTPTLLAYADYLADTKGKKKKARKVLRRAVKRDPGSAKAHYNLAVARHRAGKLDAARQSFLLAVDLDGTYDTPTNQSAFGGLDDRPVKKRSRASSTDRTEVAPLTVLISGVTSGIGRATALELAAAGHRIIGVGRRPDRLDGLAEELRSSYRTDFHSLEMDVRDREAMTGIVESLPEEWREVDVLINNAGKAKGFDPIHSGDIDHWEEMIDVNLKGLLYLTRAISPGMVDRRRGTIINVASTAGKEVYPNGNVYCATKHAVDALTYAMRLDLVAHGIRVGQVCPAHVEETEFAVVRFDGDRDRAKIYEDFQPLRSSDVARTLRFMVEQPPHVNIMDVVLQGTQQASSTVVDRSGRDRFKPAQ